MTTKNRRLKHMYNITEGTLEQILIDQDHQCALCGTDQPGDKGWCVDHDHACCPGIRSCGACLRGIVCGPCNKGLGMFKDSTELLQMAIDYVERGAIVVPVAFPEAAEARTPRVARPPRDLRTQITEYLKLNPNAGVRQVARVVDCAPSTAMEHLRVVRSEQVDEQH